MENTVGSGHTLGDRLASRLRSLRRERGWSLDVLAELSCVSRATLSRIENGDVSPTASVLGQLCSAHGLTMSRLMSLVEEEFRPLVPRDEQTVWTDPSGQFSRRSVSPPAGMLHAEVLECVLEAGASITYEKPPRKGLEHHLVLLKGSLTMTVDGQCHKLKSGDCLRYQLSGASEFVTPSQSRAHYLLVIV
jgi:transcriptional regulator with XRE-family HTH domain